MNEELVTQIRELERTQMIEEIKRLRDLNGELMAWINRRKNKLHPGDPIHEILKRATVVEK
jgi:hypothetical protein